MEQMLVENLKNKWEPVLNCEGMAPIQDNYRKNVTAILLENQEKALREEANVSPVGDRGANGFIDTRYARCRCRVRPRYDFARSSCDA